MHFAITTALVLAAAGTGLAAPTTSQPAEVPAGLEILQVIPQGEGEIVIYGDSATEGTTANEELNPAVINKRCGSNQVECHTSNQADWTNCEGALLPYLYNNQGTMQTSPRSVCYTINRYPQCCASWSKDAPGARIGQFYNAALKTYNTCLSGSVVSGKSKDTNINGVCLTQCLSVRPDGCN